MQKFKHLFQKKNFSILANNSSYTLKIISFKKKYSLLADMSRNFTWKNKFRSVKQTQKFKKYISW